MFETSLLIAIIDKLLQRSWTIVDRFTDFIISTLLNDSSAPATETGIVQKTRRELEKDSLTFVYKFRLKFLKEDNCNVRALWVIPEITLIVSIMPQLHSTKWPLSFRAVATAQLIIFKMKKIVKFILIYLRSPLHAIMLLWSFNK